MSSRMIWLSRADVQGRSNARPAAKTLPGAAKPSAPAALAAQTPVSIPKPTTGGAARAAPPIPGANRAPPPPPPPPAAPAAPPKEMYKALYNFSGQDGEMNLVKGEEVEVKEKDDNGACRHVPDCLGQAPPGQRLFGVTADNRLVDGCQERPRGMGTLELVSLRVHCYR